MSAYSDYKCGAISESEFKLAMERECGDFYDRPPDTYDYTCQECEYCRDGKVFVSEIVKRECDNRLVTAESKRYGCAEFCIKDLDNIRQIHSYDDVCEEHGELIKPEEIW